MHDISRRNLLKSAGVLGLGAYSMALLSACSNSTIQGATSGPVTIQFWTHDPGYINTFKAALADKTFTGDKFQYDLTVVQASGADVMTRAISQASAGGDTPDLIGIVIDQFPRVMKDNIASDLYMDLSDLVKEQGDNLVKTAPYFVDGKLYALESDLSVTVQYYRADVFEQNGISADVKTWDEWLQAGSELNAKTGQFLGLHPNGDNGAIFNQFLQFLLQRGGSVFNDKGEFALESQEALDVLEFMRKGIEVKAFMTATDPYGSAAAGALKDSQLVAIAMPNWYNVYGLQANVPDQEGKWKIRTLPVFSQGGHKATTLGGTGFAVGKDRPNSQAALELLKSVYLTPEGQFLRFKTAGYLPTLLDAYKSDDFITYEDKYLGGQKAFHVYAEGAQDLPTFNQNQDMNLLPDAAGEPILNVLKGTAEPKQALDQIVSNYKKQATS